MFIKKLFLKYPQQKNFLLALSGGVDSIVLLHQLFIYKEKFKHIKIRTIHINHHLYSHSLHSQQHCENICKKKNIHIILDNIYIPKNNKYGIEGYSRIKRLEIFKKHILLKEILLTAHNLNDQCENLFLSLKRKSGIDGLSGMKYSSVYHGMKIVRPLIFTPKKKIISWAKKKNLKWVEDQSNKIIQYDRNFLRNIILSKIYTKWPSFLQNCTKSMQILTQDQQSLNFFILYFLKKNIFPDGSLSLLNFKNLEKEAQYSILKKWFHQNSTKNPTYYILKRTYKEIIHNKNYYNKKIIFHNHEIRRFKNTIYYIYPGKNIKKKILYWKKINTILKLPNYLGTLIPSKRKIKKQKKDIYKLPYPSENVLVNIRFYIKKKYVNSTTKKTISIKKIWQKYNIPPWLRNTIPLLFYNDKFIAAIGIFTIHTVSLNSPRYIKIVWMNRIF
ncbi:tRNA(Ile)-lysidine synthase [Buchnera aphidicola (Cinara pseudotaxifoliae)]|uniref:tRNA(Ile)-lysidine synthase n=1 Tax=Buchnera aphidicola (Cinara pseudotaxifoliae) TaxID=655384 RepID=A0A451DGD4_9GAMM|nr:tRNA lysidine(34) synthetase TilS [Buchnera aphidicola]VFP85682.1 tRNA(Ile)-lysidine synthase [Buchnera aphidicola (Cinara pseudotaxifoliae)]